MRGRLSQAKALKATAPNQLYSWDITYLPTSVKEVFFYLYLFMDVYSRKLVGWQVYERESSEWAADIVRDIVRREGIKRQQVILHSDNGGPMKGAILLALCKPWASCLRSPGLRSATIIRIRKPYSRRSNTVRTIRYALLLS